MQPELIVLIGFMGAGKSTVGRALAQRLGWSFVDLDRWIEKRERRRIAQIFATDGEAAFRAIESEAVATVLAARKAPLVLAVGGGAWVQPVNSQRLRRAGARVIFLDASPGELQARCAAKAGKRPLFKDEDHFRQLYASRQESYLQADVRVDTGGRSVAAVTEEIALLLQAGVTHGSQN